MGREISVVGVDGCRQGWVAVELRGGRFRSAVVRPELASVVAAFPAARCFGVDIPIGLRERGPRPADLAARQLLGRRSSTLFLVPPRPAIEARDYAEAVALARRLQDGKALSKQAHALRAKILEADALRDARVHEVHPEVSFAVLAGVPLAEPKKTWAGQERRRALLSAAGIELPADLGEAGRCAPDDVLDAAAAAWTAARIASGEARRFPEVADEADESRATIRA